MVYEDSIGSLIKRFVDYRNKTIKETAMAMGIKYNTFDAQLNNNTLTAETLFRLAAYLDIDLNWMLIVLGYQGPVSAMDREMIPRMQEAFRLKEKQAVCSVLDDLIREMPDSNADIRRELKKLYKHIFYLLDVLVPDEYDIYAASTRGITKYYVDTHQSFNRGRSCSPAGRRKPISMLYDENQALDIIIEERKDRL